ncbi:hypothetical protein [Edaphobacter modestus]|uniref:Uncharacterized protein n=1 Tax=Edaphobacter modestus TaxID=388466 RepID=A0A4V2G514_9BACT|nr:hypothetical protein [Edaphobacter modestus]RZU42376.1 hypothetical protein BDD14_3944 [Edaphobacter modestus]
MKNRRDFLKEAASSLVTTKVDGSPNRLGDWIYRRNNLMPFFKGT